MQPFEVKRVYFEQTETILEPVTTEEIRKDREHGRFLSQLFSNATLIESVGKYLNRMNTEPVTSEEIRIDHVHSRFFSQLCSEGN